MNGFFKIQFVLRLQERNRNYVEFGGMMIMTSSSNKTSVPEAKGALNRFKMEVANEIGVPLTDGYNGNLTSAQNGSVGGEMVRQMIKRQEEEMSGGQQS